ncbi:MAG: hypothetical protein J0L66_08870 [Cytophagales bacterium]|nr:hypothetical protein [Cytophagales bacterium]
MKRNKIFSIGVALMMAAALVSCFDDPGTDIVLETSFLEINEAATTAGLDVGKAYERLNNGSTKKDSIRINLVGRQRSNPVTVNFTIDASSTAVPGVHYNLITTGTSVTIPANQSYAYIRFEVLPDNIDAGEVWKLRFNLTGSDAADISLSENYKYFTRSLRILCPFVRSNFTGTLNVDEPGYGTYTTVSSPDGADANTIVINNFWDFGGTVKYVFNPANTTVTLPTQDVVMGGVTYVVAQGTGNATYDACELQFVVPYTVRRKSDNALFDSNTHTFRK